MKKPIVHYRGMAYVIDGQACLAPLDHLNHRPSHRVSSLYTVTTSTVLSHDPESGRIETKNTIYMPEVTP